MDKDFYLNLLDGLSDTGKCVFLYRNLLKCSVEETAEHLFVNKEFVIQTIRETNGKKELLENILEAYNSHDGVF